MTDDNTVTSIMVSHDTKKRLKERKLLKPGGWGIETFDDVIRREIGFDKEDAP